MVSQPTCCCNWPWLLYLLVILALVLSALNFWMNLYRHEQLRSEVSAFDEKLNETIQRMENLQFMNNKTISGAVYQCSRKQWRFHNYWSSQLNLHKCKVKILHDNCIVHYAYLKLIYIYIYIYILP